jgi:hypothetical protein
VRKFQLLPPAPVVPPAPVPVCIWASRPSADCSGRRSSCFDRCPCACDK